MATDPLENRLRELSWRRKLTESETAELRAWLAAHPEAQADWAEEAALNEALEHAPEPPVASNFTARVMQAIEREAASAEKREGRRGELWLRLRRWLPQTAFAVVLVLSGMLSYQHIQTRRADPVNKLATLAANNPDAEILENFDAIRAMDRHATADEVLLKVMQ